MPQEISLGILRAQLGEIWSSRRPRGKILAIPGRVAVQSGTSGCASPARGSEGVAPDGHSNREVADAYEHRVRSRNTQA